MRHVLVWAGACVSAIVAVGVVLSLAGVTPGSVLDGGGAPAQAHAQSTAFTQAQAEAAGTQALQQELDRIAESRGKAALPYAEVGGRAITARDFTVSTPSFQQPSAKTGSIQTTMGTIQPAATLSNGVWDIHYVAANVQVPDYAVLHSPVATIDADVTIADGTGKVAGITLNMHDPN